jgi:hypothetical protein
MPRSFRHVFIASLCALAVFHPRRSLAWMEKRIDSSITHIELASDGSTTLRYELSLEVHGAPFGGLELEGVDPDAEPLGDATVTRMQGGIAISAPTPVQVLVNAGHLDIKVPLRQGLRGTSFLLRFAYRTRLLERGLIRHVSTAQSELAWVGPRFDDGVDAVTLIVRAPAAAHAPEAVSETDPERAEGANFGIVMSTLRRSQQTDELELVRAHVARGEAITWRVRLDRSLFGSSASAAATTPSVEPSPAASEAPPHAPPAPLSPGLVWAVLAGLGYALAVQLKAWQAARAAQLRNCQPRAWIGWKAPYRAALAGSLFAAAVTSIVWGDAPTLAAAALALAMAFAAQRSPDAAEILRGPGHWQTLDQSALRSAPAQALPGAWLDAGRARGFLLLVVTLATTTWLAARAFATSPYYGACILLASTALLPLFCTGRAAQMPPDALAQSRRFLDRVRRRLGRDENLVISAIGRFAAADVGLDELRLAITPARGLPGLIALELGLEFQESFGGWSACPVVVVRTVEGSACHRALPRGLTWTRGRSAEERATLVRPKLPTLAQSVGLIEELLVAMLAPESGAPASSPEAAAPGSSPKKATRSSGNGLSTAKPGTRSSPAHAT